MGPAVRVDRAGPETLLTRSHRRVSQYGYFWIASEFVTAEQITAQVGMEPDSISSLRGSWPVAALLLSRQLQVHISHDVSGTRISQEPNVIGQLTGVIRR